MTCVFQPLGRAFRKGVPTVFLRVKVFATCLVFAQDSGFMDYVKDIFLIPQFLNPSIRNSGLSGLGGN